MMNKLIDIESKFKEITGIPTDLSIFPITEHFIQNSSDNVKSHGEVFTPLNLVDKMVLQADPKPDQFNLDLCAGQGQFTVRMLRYMYNIKPFDIDSYLKNYHWFNELNPDNVKTLIKIFGKNINILEGDANKLNEIPTYKIF